jgi:glycosyltransferase involved in cell wall biosynthesis
LYKEIKLAQKKGFQAEVICFEFDNWSKDINQQLLKGLEDIKVISIPAGRERFFLWLISMAKEKLFRITGKLFSLPLPLLAQAVSRRNSLLIQSLNKISIPDWVIGHNPGALWATSVAGKKFQCRTGFDVEDYHPGEGEDRHLQQLNKTLLQQVLPLMSYVTFASPLIQQTVQNDTGVGKKSWFTLMNYSLSSEFRPPVTLVEKRVKMVWFSQNISSGRGLELILPFVKENEGLLELHLIGNMDQQFFQSSLKDCSSIIIHSPLSQKKLHQQLALYDIGLALEPAKDKNNELAVSNKILAYLQAGLFILATNTPAQVNLLSDLPGFGYCFDHLTNNSDKMITKMLAEINNIRNGRQSRYRQFHDQNWETASRQLLNTWEHTS